MGLIATDTSGGSNFKRVPAGSHIARCFSIADLGTHTTDGQYGPKTNRKLRLAWEIFGDDENNEPLTIDVNGKEMPMVISKNYNLILGERANLRKELASWRGRDFTEQELKGFDIASIIGIYCMLNVTHSENNGKTYSNVSGISPLHKTMQKPTPVHDNQIFDLDKPDMKVFNTFYDSLKDYIQQSPEWATFENNSNYNDQRNHSSDIEDNPF